MAMSSIAPRLTPLPFSWCAGRVLFSLTAGSSVGMFVHRWWGYMIVKLWGPKESILETMEIERPSENQRGPRISNHAGFERHLHCGRVLWFHPKTLSLSVIVIVPPPPVSAHLSVYTKCVEDGKWAHGSPPVTSLHLHKRLLWDTPSISSLKSELELLGGVFKLQCLFQPPPLPSFSGIVVWY